ncbi:Tkp3 protein, partial [Vanderwaltozyma polyspora DSM 70294]
SKFCPKFIGHCSPKAGSINQSITDPKIGWLQEQHKCYIKPNSNLCNPHLLVQSHEDGLYRLTIVVSTEGYGEVLEEIDINHNVIYLGVADYFSRSLQKSHRNYTVSGLELQAITGALRYVRYILYE